MANEPDARLHGRTDWPAQPAEVPSDPDFRPPGGSSNTNGPGRPGVPVGEVVTATVAVIGPNVTLRAAAEHMKRSGTAFLLVSDVAQFCGVLTDQSVTDWVTAGEAGTALVRDVMTPGVDVCSADQDVSEVARLMRARGVSWLVVLDQAVRPVGVVALADLVGIGGNDVPSGESGERSSVSADPPRR